MGMNPFDRQTVTLALPGARLGAMPAAGGGAAAGVDDDAQRVLDHAELGGAYSSADTMSYDDVVEPRELRNSLLAIGYLDSQNPDAILSELRRLLSRAGATERELTLVRGMARQIAWAGRQART